MSDLRLKIVPLSDIRARICACCAKRKFDTGRYLGAAGELFCAKCGTSCSISCRLVDAKGRTLATEGVTYDLLYMRKQPQGVA